MLVLWPRLMVRQFSAPAPMVSQLVTHPVHNDTRDEVAYYTVTNLAPDTGYTGTVLHCTVLYCTVLHRHQPRPRHRIHRYSTAL